MKRILHAKGYVLIKMPDHPRAHNGYVLEHIVVAEGKLGRRIRKNESVHHINHVRSDNDPSNLDVLSRSNHARLHNAPRRKRRKPCVSCGSLTSRIKYCSVRCVNSRIKWPPDRELEIL
jgi:hypothetical protein